MASIFVGVTQPTVNFETASKMQPRPLEQARHAPLWCDECLLRYANRSFSRAVSALPELIGWKIQNISKPEEPDNDARALLHGLATEVPNSPLIYGTKELNTNDHAIYDLAQCTRDLNAVQCFYCLTGLIKTALQTCDQNSSIDMRASNTEKIVAVLLSCSIYYRVRRKKNWAKNSGTADGLQHRTTSDFAHSNISMEESQASCISSIPRPPIQLASHEFSEQNKLGQVGFGPVYQCIFSHGNITMPSSPRSTIIVVLLTTLWLVMISLTSTAPSDRKYYIWTENIQTMATPNNIYFSNLDLLVSSLSQSTAQSNSFHTATVNRLYGLYLCRGDTTAGVCRDCVATAATDIRKLCPNSSEAIIWYDMCLLRYSNASFFGALESNMNTLMWNLQNNSQPDDPDMDAGALMYGLASDLLASPLMYETKEKELNVTEASYDVGQCSRDLDDANCSKCLA